MRALPLLAGLVAACNLSGSVSLDAGADAEPDARDAGVDTDPDAGSREGGLSGGGPVTLVARRVELLEERLCDLDGDGLDDNAIASLGPVERQLMTAALNSLIQGTIEQGTRVVMHYDWVDDRARPHAPSAGFVYFEGTDLDNFFDQIPDNADTSDDFSGHEPYYINRRYIDACGEPTHVSEDGAILEGELSATAELLPMPFGDGTITGQSARMWGTLAPGCVAAETWTCAVATVSELGEVESPRAFQGATVLEALLAGGAALGLASLPGLQPDLDLDGDGLERLVLSSDDRIASCIDGDSTVIEGSDCWLDERIADGYAMTSRADLVSATFAGCQPGWRDAVDESCESPPEQSFCETHGG